MSRQAPKELLKAYQDALAAPMGAELQSGLPANPYVGLKPYELKTSRLLVARDDAGSATRQKFEELQTVFVVGGSGCGKSSVVRGRVLSDLETQSQPIGGRFGSWFSVTFRPVRNPMREFAQAVWRDVFEPYYELAEGHDPADTQDARRILDQIFDPGLGRDDARSDLMKDVGPREGTLRNYDNGFRLAWDWINRLDNAEHDGQQPAEPSLLIVIDQFEEIFRSNVDRREADQIYAMIRYVHRFRPPGVYLAVTMRSEDLHRCSQVSELTDIVNESMFLIDWLSDKELREAIVEPARRVLRAWGIPFDREDPDAPYETEVVDQLVEQVGTLQRDLGHKSDHLPLMQHGLHQLWRAIAAKWTLGNETGFARIRKADLLKIMSRHGENRGSWFRGILDHHAGEAFREARKRFAKARGDRFIDKINSNIAIRAALCEMASLDENRRYHRQFVTIEEVVEKRFPGLSEAETTRLVTCLDRALGAFVDANFLIRFSGTERASFDVVHEAFIRNFSKLESWIETESKIVQAMLGSIPMNSNEAELTTEPGMFDWLKFRGGDGLIQISGDDVKLLGRVFSRKRIAGFLASLPGRKFREDSDQIFTERWLG
ncbi:MAG: hypothetical protein AAF501_15290, partial [Pseudomonadota bacterium]